MRKLLVLVLCGFVQRVACSRMRFEQPFQEPLCRPDPQLQGGPILKREHFFPRGGIIPTEQMMPQPTVMRAEPIFVNEPFLPRPPQQQIPNEHFLPNEQIIQAEPIIRNEAFIPPEPVLRRDPYIRREPVFRREPFFRGSAMCRGGRPTFFRNEPSPYALLVAQCPCSCNPMQMPNAMQPGPQEEFFPVPQQQPQQQQQQQPQILAPRIIFQKPMIRPQTFHPVMAIPIQRFMPKGFKPVPENIQFAPPAPPRIQELNSFGRDPPAQLQPGNFQNQEQQQENTSESSQNNPVTARNIPQGPNPLSLAQVSSIC